MPVFDERARQPNVASPRRAPQSAETLRTAPRAGEIGPALMTTLQASVGNQRASAAVRRLSVASTTSQYSTSSRYSTSTRHSTPSPAPVKKGFRDTVADALERVREKLDVVDNAILRGQIPTDSALGWQATRTRETPLSDHVAGASAFAAAENGITDSITAAGHILDAHKARKEAKENPVGPASHAPRKKFKTKVLDAIQSLVATGSDAISLAKSSITASGEAAAAGVAEAGGGVFAAFAAAKSVRALRRISVTTRKYRAIKKIHVPAHIGEDELARLNEELEQSLSALRKASDGLDRANREHHVLYEGQMHPAAYVWLEALGESKRVQWKLKREQDIDALNTTKAYALRKQRTKVLKLGVGAVGEATRAAGGAVTIAVAATGAAGALGSNPVGWALAGVAAGFLLSVTAYKTGRAGRKRYEIARHPDRWSPPVEDEDGVTPTEPASRKDALKEALKFWKKVENGERQAMARTIYGLAAGPDVPVGWGTSPEVRASARELLVALKAGPAKMRMTEEAWAQSLNDRADAEKWRKEIANQLSSG